ncbi:MAG: GTPase HflX [Myxococcota bacterium]
MPSPTDRHHATERPQRRAMLVSVQLPDVPDAEVTISLDELEHLCKGLGLTVVHRLTQKRPNLTAALLLGGGKLHEAASWTGGTGEIHVGPRNKTHGGKKDKDEAELPESTPEPRRADLVVVDTELVPGQQRNLERALGVEVLDRTGIILLVFEARARTREARLELELARLLYDTPRLRDDDNIADREGGGGGRGGRGHTNLELAKQRTRDRTAALRKELETVRATEDSRRARRTDQARVALVGYTNSGKSSLMRVLTGSEVYVQDALFATLGTTVRALQPETTPRILVADTVGFLRNLPHGLVASFRSTLEEAREAGLLLIVLDASDPEMPAHLAVTRQVLAEIGAGDIPVQLLLHKTDRVEPAALEQLSAQFPEALRTSTRDPDTMQALRQAIVDYFDSQMAAAQVDVPYAKLAMLGEIRAATRVLEETYHGEGVRLMLRAPASVLEKLRRTLR